ncbi:unnamed protein product [Mytilus edulis]|uniref:SUEL-type lectin domain-containing protein n=1 Tax=Mytilus edulis TaxID=6550 RepID=A0A8S3R531_MYTED|nr:unnamed protein product [Mytilus edulis]
MLYIFSYYLVIYYLAQTVTTLHTYLLCENNNSHKLECCPECSIQIIQATYGRTNITVCPHRSLSEFTKNCTDPALTGVREKCDGKKSCQPLSKNNIYGADPCPYVHKYLNVTYNCMQTEKTTANIDLTTPDTKTNPLAYTETTTEKTTANIDLATPDTDTDPLSCRCPCSLVGPNKWGYLRHLNLSLAQLEGILKPDLDILQKLIAINKTNTTMNLRTKYSAADDRISAVSIGYETYSFYIKTSEEGGEITT